MKDLNTIKEMILDKYIHTVKCRVMYYNDMERNPDNETSHLQWNEKCAIEFELKDILKEFGYTENELQTIKEKAISAII